MKRKIKVLVLILVMLISGLFISNKLYNKNIKDKVKEDVLASSKNINFLNGTNVSKNYEYEMLAVGNRYVWDETGTGYSCGTPIWIDSCDSSSGAKICYFTVGGSKKQINANKLTDDYNDAMSKCKKDNSSSNSTSSVKKNTIQQVWDYRYVMEGYSKDGLSNYTCGTSIYIETCDSSSGTKVCYFTDNDGIKKEVYGMKLSTNPEGALATCSKSKYGDRYVVGEGSNYKCGDKLYITDCQGNTCYFSGGTVNKTDLRNTESVAKSDCDKLGNKGYRYVTRNGVSFKCSDKLFITTCDENKCKYTSINGKKVEGTIDRSFLKETKAVAESACGVKGNRYIAVDNDSFDCGDEIYITDCSDTICNYTRLNGKDKSGTINRDYLDDDLESSKSRCSKVKNNDFGDRFVMNRSANYECGDKLYITTCTDKVCNFTKVNGNTISGNVDRNALNDSQDLAKAECDKGAVYGKRYVVSEGSNYKCGDELYVTECDADICVFTQVNGLESTGAVSRNDLRVTNPVGVENCSAPKDFGDRYVSVDGSNYKCGDKLYITTCTDVECNYTSVNGVSASGVVDRYSINVDESLAKTACLKDVESGERYVTVNGDNYSCGDTLYVTSCSEYICNYSKVITAQGLEKKVEGTIDKDLLKEDKALADSVCEATNVSKEQKKCDNQEMKNMTGSSAYTFCFYEKASLDKVKNDLEDYYKCDEKNGYSFDKTSVVAVGKADCNGNGVCTQTFNVNCTKGKNAKPVVSVTSGFVQSNGKGTIIVEATANEGTIHSYYASSEYLVPTGKSNWKKVDGDKFSINSTPGIQYIWVKDSKGNVSSPVTGVVFDSSTYNTTLNKLELSDSNGTKLNANRVVYESETLQSNKYVLLSNDLSKDSKVLADGFNPFDMEYKLEVSSPTVSVYATLTSTDSSYVPGYEPRTVNLDYGVNTILIKIKNNEGKERTYTILVTRVDDRTSDNTLREITVSEGNINYNANVTDYKIEISSNTKSVDVKSVISSDKASYVEGYEPGIVNISGDTTVKLIKVKSETGSTRTYVLTFVKKGTDKIVKDSLMLSDLVIPGINMAFEESIANYSLSVGYENESIDFKPVLKDENSSYILRSKRKNDTTYKETSGTGVALDVGENFIEIEITDSDKEKSYYRITIIRKEFGLEISSDTQLKDLKVLGYDIDFNPKTKDYTVRIKQEKSLVITAVPASNRAEVFIRGNDELTGFSTVRIKVVAENGDFETYSVDIKKDAFNKVIEIGAIVVGAIVIVGASIIIITRKKSKANKEYFEE